MERRGGKKVEERERPDKGGRDRLFSPFPSSSPPPPSTSSSFPSLFLSFSPYISSSPYLRSGLPRLLREGRPRPTNRRDHSRSRFVLLFLLHLPPPPSTSFSTSFTTSFTLSSSLHLFLHLHPPPSPPPTPPSLHLHLFPPSPPLTSFHLFLCSSFSG